MANSENTASIAGRETGGESLPGLLGRVGEDLATLLDAKLGLLKIEIEEDLRAYARGGAAIGVGSVIGAVGFALLNVGIGFLISALFENTQLSQPMKYALGFLFTGAIYLLLGGGVVILNKKRLAGRGIVPERSIAELQKDKQWLKNEM
jgi:Putative Actinobacterial Holin-X, holin superfamily III